MKIKIISAAAVFAAAMTITAYSAEERFAIVSAPSALSEELWGADYQSYTRILARHADDKALIPMSGTMTKKFLLRFPMKTRGEKSRRMFTTRSCFPTCRKNTRMSFTS